MIGVMGAERGSSGTGMPGGGGGVPAEGSLGVVVFSRRGRRGESEDAGEDDRSGINFSAEVRG